MELKRKKSTGKIVPIKTTEINIFVFWGLFFSFEAKPNTLFESEKTTTTKTQSSFYVSRHINFTQLSNYLPFFFQNLEKHERNFSFSLIYRLKHPTHLKVLPKKFFILEPKIREKIQKTLPPKIDFWESKVTVVNAFSPVN